MIEVSPDIRVTVDQLLHLSVVLPIKAYSEPSPAVVFEPAVYYASHGFPVTPRIAAAWRNAEQSYQGYQEFADAFLPHGRAPNPGELVEGPYRRLLKELLGAQLVHREAERGRVEIIQMGTDQFFKGLCHGGTRHRGFIDGAGAGPSFWERNNRRGNWFPALGIRESRFRVWEFGKSEPLGIAEAESGIEGFGEEGRSETFPNSLDPRTPESPNQPLRFPAAPIPPRSESRSRDSRIPNKKKGAGKRLFSSWPNLGKIGGY